MDKITVGELLALYNTIGMTVNINDGHVISITHEEVAK